MDDTLISLHDLEICAAQAEVVTRRGREALRLENGLVLAPEGTVKDASIEVLIGTDGPAYPGVAFRVADVLNFELAYREMFLCNAIQLRSLGRFCSCDKEEKCQNEEFPHDFQS